jgi:hypothetical protein
MDNKHEMMNEEQKREIVGESSRQQERIGTKPQREQIDSGAMPAE